VSGALRKSARAHRGAGAAAVTLAADAAASATCLLHLVRKQRERG
jgi:hypothetical protein